MQLRSPAWWRSVRSRPAAFVAVLILSFAAVLVSSISPMLLTALDATTLREQVAQARPPDDGVTASAQIGVVADEGTAQRAVARVLAAAARGSDRWGPTEQVVESKAVLRIDEARSGEEGLPIGASVIPSRCRGLVLVSGACPVGELDVAVPAALARARGWRVGTELSARVPSSLGALDLQVVGVYADTSGAGRVIADPAVLEGAVVPRAVPNLAVTGGAIDAFGGAAQLTGARLLTRTVRPGDVPRLLRGVAAAERAATGEDAAETQLVVHSGLPGLFDDVAQVQAASATLLGPIGLAALVLAWTALFLVAQRTARARAVEWGVDRARGLRVRAWLAAVLVEPLIGIAVGAVVGYAAAAVVALPVARAVLGPGAVIDPLQGLAPAAGAFALAGSATALFAATARAALLPLEDLLHDAVEPRRASRAALVARMVLLTLTAAVLYSAVTAPPSAGPQLGLLLPVLLALLTGLVGRLVAVAVVRRVAVRPPRGLGRLVIGRGLARAPSILAAAQLMLVGTALAAYVLQVQAVSAATQTNRAQLRTGAAEVFTVAVPRGASLLSAVRRADPGGRTALAAVQVGSAQAEGAAALVAVDTTRLDAVSTWRTAWRGRADLARLRPSGHDLVLRGSSVALRVRGVDGASEELGLPADPGVRVTAVLAAARGWAAVDLGLLRDGVLTGRIPCGDGCRFVALQLEDVEAQPYPWGARFTITGLSTDRQPATSLGSWTAADRWRDRVVNAVDPARPARTVMETAPTGFTVIATDRGGDGTPALEPAVGPEILPALPATGAPVTPFAGVAGAVQGASLSPALILLGPIGAAPVLPRTLNDGVLVDLAAAERVTDPAETIGTQQVWTTPGAHPALLERLRRQGVRVIAHESAAAATASALTAATNRALVLGGTAAVAGVLVALLGVVAVRVIDGPGRRREWSVLRLAGADRSRLRRLAVLQVFAPAFVAVLLGVGSGLLAARLTVGGLPLIVVGPPGPPEDLGLPVTAVAVLAVATAALLAVIALVAARADLGRTSR